MIDYTVLLLLLLVIKVQFALIRKAYLFVLVSMSVFFSPWFGVRAKNGSRYTDKETS